ncbi:hypothetical protein [Citrobacter amalonaticus]|uniref:hypothetical protein n=1 Tax=Citrobacter amalonaticus TaxID=35703 RepID=UPI00117C8AEE|nr:hypothetical protein [Citrobacter amalonaticus]
MISGLGVLLVGVFCEALGFVLSLDGAACLVGSWFVVVWDAFVGLFFLSDGGILSPRERLFVVYFGVADAGLVDVFGVTFVDGGGSFLVVVSAVYLGGFFASRAAALGMVSVFTVVTVYSVSLIVVAYGDGGIGIFRMVGFLVEGELVAGFFVACGFCLMIRMCFFPALLLFEHCCPGLVLVSRISGYGVVGPVGCGLWSF